MGAGISSKTVEAISVFLQRITPISANRLKPHVLQMNANSNHPSPSMKTDSVTYWVPGHRLRHSFADCAGISWKTSEAAPVFHFKARCWRLLEHHKKKGWLIYPNRYNSFESQQYYTLSGVL